jgi:hypothetical protein
MALGSEDMLLGGVIGAAAGFLAALLIGAAIPPTSGPGRAGINVSEYHPEAYHPDNTIVEEQGNFY